MTDFIILGQGLAGSILGYKLSKLGFSIKIINLYQPQTTSSWVAAGLFNPVTVRKLSLSWNASFLFQALNQFYPQLEMELAGQFFFEKKIIRLMDSPAMQNDWLARISSGLLGEFCESAELYPLENKHILNPFGCLCFSRGGYVDTMALLEAMRNRFLTNDELLEVTVPITPSEIYFKNGGVEIRNLKSKTLIDCSGYTAASFYGMDLLFKPVKGEILTVRIPDLHLESIVLKGVFIASLGKDVYRVGATYDWDLSMLTPTPEGKSKLLEELKKITPLPAEVLDHKAGIRPASKDRRPLIGKLPVTQSFDSAYIFNGFGTKGVALIPYYADHFIEHLFNNAPLEREVDMGRFVSIYR